MCRKLSLWLCSLLVAANCAFAQVTASSGIQGTVTDKSGAAHVLPFSDISSAKLLLTDKLINATAPLSTEGADSIQTIEE